VHGGPKKRQYAAQAFEFGSGANAAITPSAAGGVGGASTYPPGGMTGPAGYPAESFAPAPVGYTPSQPGYEAPGVASMTNQFGQMGLGGRQPLQPAPQLQVC